MERSRKQRKDETITGLPELKPEENVEVTGTGEKFSGQSDIAKANHTISDTGYAATFNKRKKTPAEEKG